MAPPKTISLDQMISDHLAELTPEERAEYERGYQQFKAGVMLQAEREAKGLTQQELAARTHISLSTIQKIERGARLPSWATLEKIAAALGKHIKISLVEA